MEEGGYERGIRRATEAVGLGDVRGGLEGCLEAWRAVREPELAELIEGLSSLAAEELPGLPMGKGGDAAWLERAGTGDPRELALLLPLVAQTTVLQAHWRVEALDAHPPDPRIAAAMVEQLEGLPFMATGGRFYTAVHRQLRRCVDPRVHERLRALVGGFEGRLGGTTAVATHERQLARTLTLLEADFAADERARAARGGLVSARIEELRRVIEGRAEQAQTGPRLLAQIQAEPDELLHRQVYADWLLARGDPRGEFIALQLAADAGPLTRKAQARMRALEREHGRGWLGPLHWVLVREATRFARGFVVAGRISAHARAPASFAGATECASNEALAAAPLEVLVHPVMVALREVEATDEVAEALLSGAGAGRPLPGITSLCVRYGAFDRAALAAREQCSETAGLPNLRQFTVEVDVPIPWSRAEWLWTTPLAASITTAELRLHPDTGLDPVQLALSLLRRSRTDASVSVVHGGVRYQLGPASEDRRLIIHGSANLPEPAQRALADQASGSLSLQLA